MQLEDLKKHKAFIVLITAAVFLLPLAGCAALAVQNHSLRLTISKMEEQQSSEASDNQAVPVSGMAADPNLPSYMYLYPQLYINHTPNDYKETKPRTVYLTFDDGPSKLTPQVLDILKEHNVKATFFILYHDDPFSRQMYNRIIAEGHTIGIHGTTHKYKEIYQSVDAFLNDFANAAVLVQNSTGVAPEIFRFPGGSINSFNRDTHEAISAEMLRRGYEYYDWNVSSGDASSRPISAFNIYANVVNSVSGKDRAIVLMHDSATKAETVKALPMIIQGLKDSGYQFASLNNTVKPIRY